MNRRRIFTVWGIVLILALAFPACCLLVQLSEGGPAQEASKGELSEDSGATASITSYSLLRNCRDAQYAFVGRVVSRQPTACGLRDLAPYTPIVFEVEERIKGNPPMQFTFQEAGGQMGSIVFTDWGNHHYQPGERAVVFVKENGYPISGGSEFQLTNGGVILPAVEKLEGLPIPSCQPRDENGWVIFSQQQFIHYLKSLCRFMPS